MLSILARPGEAKLFQDAKATMAEEAKAGPPDDLPLARTRAVYMRCIVPTIDNRASSCFNTHLWSNTSTGFGATLAIANRTNRIQSSSNITSVWGTRARIDEVERYVSYLHAMLTLYKRGKCRYFNALCNKAVSFDIALVRRCINSQPSLMLLNWLATFNARRSALRPEHALLRFDGDGPVLSTPRSTVNPVPPIPRSVWDELMMIAGEKKAQFFIARKALDSAGERFDIKLSSPHESSLHNTLCQLTSIYKHETNPPSQLSTEQARDDAADHIVTWYAVLWIVWTEADGYENIPKLVGKARKTIKKLEKNIERRKRGY